MGQESSLHAHGGKDGAGEHPQREGAGMAEQPGSPCRQSGADGDDAGDCRDQTEGNPGQAEGRIHLLVPFSAFTRSGWAAM